MPVTTTAELVENAHEDRVAAQQLELAAADHQQLIGVEEARLPLIGSLRKGYFGNWITAWDFSSAQLWPNGKNMLKHDSHPDPNFFYPGSASKNLNILIQKIVSKLS